MNKILELREKRAKAWETAKAFLDTKRGTDGLISAEDTNTYDKMEADVVNLGKEIERLERQQTLDLELSKPLNLPLTSKPTTTGETKKGRSSDEYKSAFWDNLKSRNYLDVKNALQIGTDSEGGYLVPDEYEQTLVQALEEENIFRKLGTVIKTSTSDRKIPIVTAKGSAVWMDEEGSYIESNDEFGQAAIAAYKLGTMIKVSDELLNDNVFNLQGYIANEFGRRIGAKEEEAFFIGNGTGKPTGVFNTTGGAEIGTTTKTTAITFDDVMDLYYSLRAPYRKKAVWTLNYSTVKALRKLKDGNGNYIWQPSVQLGVPDMILNRPYHTSSFIPEATAGNKVMAFGDFSYYWIADRQGRSFKRLNELYAATGQVGFLASQRVDGKLILPEAIKVLKMKTA